MFLEFNESFLPVKSVILPPASSNIIAPAAKSVGFTEKCIAAWALPHDSEVKSFVTEPETLSENTFLLRIFNNDIILRLCSKKSHS